MTVYWIIDLDPFETPVSIVMPVVVPIVTSFPITFLINQLIANLMERDRINLQQQEELRLLAIEAARQKEVAEAMSHAKSSLLANMSHELRTPLNAIIGFSDLFQGDTIDRLKPEQIRQYATDINLSGRHLLGLVNDLLELARIEKGSRDFHAEPVHVGEKIVEVSRIMRTQAEEAKVELVIPDSRDLIVAHTDDLALRQILLNLISNAVKFTPEGGWIKIDCVIEEGMVAIRISDTGIGIPSEEVDRIFEPFSQVDNSLTRRKTGTGLGLALVRTMVEQQDGSIGVQSELGIGTTFTVRLPAGEAKLTQAAE
jgi:two-component system cell cycle sensor histidine kinase PleC